MPPATYAPTYRRISQQRSQFVDERLRPARKHLHASKKDHGTEDDSDSSTSQAEIKLASAVHPVNSKDPYYVAGHPREVPLPPPPFPYAAVHDSKPKVDVEAELCKLNPPIFSPATRHDDSSTSLKRRHLDNLTAILHSRILKRDWKRASRVFGLILRTEVQSHVDIRHHDRWTLAGEILLNRGSRDGATSESTATSVSGYGCKSARDLYERMILCYPYSQRMQHTVNAATIFPALFNVWIYDVQDRSKRALASLAASQSSTNEHTEHEADRRAYCNIRQHELDDASDIAARLEHLLAVPPYDTDRSMRRLRAMIALWIGDVCRSLVARATEDGKDDVEDLSAAFADPDLDELRRRADTETDFGTRSMASLEVT